MVGIVLLAGGIRAAPEAAGGAPNYECRVGSLRLGIDQHRGRVVMRLPGQAPDVADITTTNQNGESLDLTTNVRGATWAVSVRGLGSSLIVRTGTQALRGDCTFVPGNFVLGTVADNAVAVHALPADGARVLTALPRGSLVWSVGNFDESTNTLAPPEWSYVHVVFGATRSDARRFNSPRFSGWLRLAGVHEVCVVHNRRPGWDPPCVGALP